MAFLTRALAGAAVAFLFGPLSVLAATPVSEDQVKAVFLYRLIRFVEWPEETFRGTHPNLVMCVVSADAFADLLDEVVKSNPHSGPEIEVRRLAGVSGARGCQIVYFGASERHRVRAALTELAGAHVLTAGATEGFAAQGCVLDFWVETNKLRFAVNLEAASHGGLKMSSNLLSLAAEVIGR
jgi:YfiR/HmsC-like